MTYTPEHFSLQPATPRDFPALVSLYNNTIMAAHASNERQVGWTPFTAQTLAQKAERRNIYKAQPNQPIPGVPGICAAVMLDNDRSTWLPHMQWLDDKTARFTKFAVAADTRLKGFGREVAWPLLKETAQEAGYTGLYCEAIHEKLHTYYEKLGMTALDLVMYYNPEYDDDIVVRPFYYSLVDEPRPESAGMPRDSFDTLSL